MQRTAAPLLLGCLSVLTAPPPSRCSVLLHPPQLLVRFGGSLNVTCRSSCPSPPSGGGVETSSLYEARPLGASTLHVELLNVSEWRSSVQCYFRCGGSREARKAELRAYRPLDNPELSPIPPLRSGRPYNLSCFVPKVSPISNLTLALLLDNLTLHTATFWGRPQEEPEDVLVTHEVTPRREDHGRSATCRAVLDLQPYGPLYDSVSTARLLEVYAPPYMDDQLCPPTRTWTEGQEVALWCIARGKPEPEVRCHKEGSGDVLVQRPGTVRREHSGTYRCQASNSLGTAERGVSVRVEYWEVNVGLWVALSVAAAVGAAAGLVAYRLYYRKKKIRHYELQKKQQQRLMDLEGRAEGAESAPNGSAPGVQA